MRGGGLEAISKTFLVPLRKSPMANETCFLIGKWPKLMMSILYECTICKRNNLIISKNGVFGTYAIIDQIHLRIPLKPRVI